VIDVDTQLHEAGERWRAAQPLPHVDFERVATRRRSRSVIAIGVAALVAAALVAIGFVATRATTGTHVRVVQEPPTSPVTAPPSPVLRLNYEITQVQAFTAVDGKLWVTGDAPIPAGAPRPDPQGQEGPAHVQEIDAASGAVVVDVTLPDNWPYALAVGDGAVWVRAQQGEASTALFKIDPATKKIVATLDGHNDGGLVVTPSAIWINDNGGLQRVDPRTGKAIATIPLVSAGPYTSLFVVAGPLGTWTANGYTGQVQHIDTTQNTAGPPIQITTGNQAIEWIGETDHSLWVQEYPNQLVEFDVNGRKLRTLMIGTGERTFAPTSDGRYIWLGTEHSYVFRVDTTTGAIRTINLPTGFSGATNLSIDPTTGDIWASTLKPAPRFVLISRGVTH
jgi:hypothetical protein